MGHRGGVGQRGLGGQVFRLGCMDSVSPAETHLGTHLSGIPQGIDLSPSLVLMLPDRYSVVSPTPTVRGRGCLTEDLRDLRQGDVSRKYVMSHESEYISSCRIQGRKKERL